jgi:hypothetical protein
MSAYNDDFVSHGVSGYFYGEVVTILPADPIPGGSNLIVEVLPERTDVIGCGIQSVGLDQISRPDVFGKYNHMFSQPCFQFSDKLKRPVVQPRPLHVRPNIDHKLVRPKKK